MGIPVRMEYDDRTGWLLVTPWPLTSAAFQNACRKACEFYSRLALDMRGVGRPEDAERMGRGVEALKQNKVRNIVDQSMVNLLGLEKAGDSQEVNFPGVLNI